MATQGCGWISAVRGLQYCKFVAGFIKSEPPWYRELWAALNDRFDAKPVTLVHGDCRLGNMIFLAPSAGGAGAGAAAARGAAAAGSAAAAAAGGAGGGAAAAAAAATAL